MEWGSKRIKDWSNLMCLVLLVYQGREDPG